MAVADESMGFGKMRFIPFLSPEGFASILWKDASLAEKAAKAMKLTSYDLYKAGFVETIIPEPETYTLETMLEICETLRRNDLCFSERKNESAGRGINRGPLRAFPKNVAQGWSYGEKDICH